MSKVKNLMPNQFESFNGDHFIAEEFLKLRDKFNVERAVELGTCYAGTTVFLGQNFKEVFTVEINPDHLAIAKERLNAAGATNVNTILGDSGKVLLDLLKTYDTKDNSLIFNDSHWNSHCPLLDELAAIAEAKIKPVIAIHDFKTDDPRMGFDSYNGQDFELEWIKPSIDKIYGKGKWEYYYNTFERSTEVRRGIIFITPKHK